MIGLRNKYHETHGEQKKNQIKLCNKKSQRIKESI